MMDGLENFTENDFAGDEELARDLVGGDDSPVDVDIPPNAGGESCIILIETARGMVGVTEHIPTHIAEMWKNAYNQVSEKYGFDLLAGFGGEISLCIASYLIYQDTITRLPPSTVSSVSEND